MRQILIFFSLIFCFSCNSQDKTSKCFYDLIDKEIEQMIEDQPHSFVLSNLSECIKWDSLLVTIPDFIPAKIEKYTGLKLESPSVNFFLEKDNDTHFFFFNNSQYKHIRIPRSKIDFTSLIEDSKKEFRFMMPSDSISIFKSSEKYTSGRRIIKASSN